uniref:Uncharacterized protein n=1 Tax=Ditylum brightwellii TaxID=49249 RepID=A0A7S4TBE6_9STRA
MSSDIDRGVADVGGYISDITSRINSLKLELSEALDKTSLFSERPVEMAEVPFPESISSEPINFQVMEQAGQPTLSYESANEINLPVGASMDEVTSKLSEGLDLAREAGSVEIAKLSDGFFKAGSTGAAQISKLFGDIGGIPGGMAAKSGSALQETGTTFDFGGNVFAEQGSALIAATGQVRLLDIEDSVISGFAAVGNTFINILDYVAVTYSGSAASDVLASAQASVNGVVNGAIQSAVQTINDIGEINLAQLVKSLVILVTTVAKVLFQILSMVIKAVSGKGISEWNIDVSGYMVQETSKLMAQASATASDLNEKSLSELIDMIDSFFYHVGTLAADSFATILEIINSSGDPLAGALAYNSAETASHLSSFMTNL